MNTFLNKPQVKGKIRKEIRKYSELDENENKTHQSFWDTAKAVLRGKQIASKCLEKRKISNEKKKKSELNSKQEKEENDEDKSKLTLKQEKKKRKNQWNQRLLFWKISTIDNSIQTGGGKKGRRNKLPISGIKKKHHHRFYSYVKNNKGIS